MKHRLNVRSRHELVNSLRSSYSSASHEQKSKIIDGLVAALGYDRKYAIRILNNPPKTHPKSTKGRKLVYGTEVKQALITAWKAANQICSKRLVPFLPELVCSLERHGYLSISEETRSLLLKISPATVDRILEVERTANKRAIGITKPGSLLKKQIKIRTFADWDDTTPGFMEADLVSHCGGNTSGNFTCTLVLTDIATSWTEFFPLLNKGAAGVIEGLKTAQKLMPFKLIGFDTDNGSEFINHEILEFCKNHEITFTRSRSYKKNDQAYVEERNGSIIRRIVGYDRYEGQEAFKALGELYSLLRIYVNFYQPSMKLKKKIREGSKVKKIYSKAQTPLTRYINIQDKLSTHLKDLKRSSTEIDPVKLLSDISDKQKKLIALAWKVPIIKGDEIENIQKESEKNNLEHLDLRSEPQRYPRSKKTRKKIENRNWKTRPDPFAEYYNEIKIKLELNPQIEAKSLLLELIEKYPNKFHLSHLRTLQRRISSWRKEWVNYQQKQLAENTQQYLQGQFNHNFTNMK